MPRATVESELLLAGYTEDRVVLAHSDSGFVTTDLFTRYVRDVLILHINFRRWEMKYYGPAVVIWDNCSCHCHDAIRELLEANNVRLVSLPPHSSDQLQPLDVGLFGNMKGAQTRVHVPDEMSMQSRQVIRIMSAFHATCHPQAITSAFRRAGVSTRLESGRLFCVVTPGTCGALRCEIAERFEDLLRLDSNRFDKARVEIQGGLLGEKPDRLLEYAGVNALTGELRNLPNLPAELERWDPVGEWRSRRFWEDSCRICRMLPNTILQKCGHPHQPKLTKRVPLPLLSSNDLDSNSHDHP